jgi:multiple antibiotic resistance protein
LLSTGAIVYIFVTLLAMINPLEAAGAFETLTSRMPGDRQRAVALRSTIVAAAILIAFGIVGNALLSVLGISLQAFKIAGGLLLLKVGFDMVFAQEQTGDEAANAEGKTSRPSPDPSVFPLAIPIISGPGALTAIVTIFGKVQGNLTGHAIVIEIALAVFTITYATMRLSARLTRLLGQSGVNAVGRIVGIIVAAIAVQLTIDGIGEITKSVIH